jgi:hypothetical protein
MLEEVAKGQVVPKKVKVVKRNKKERKAKNKRMTSH